MRDVERNSGKKITNSHISKILNDKATNLTADKIVALAEGLQVSPHEVFSVISGHPVTEGEEFGSVAAFADLMQKVAVNLVLSDIVQELLQMPVKHQRVMLEGLKFANGQRQKESKKRPRR